MIGKTISHYKIIEKLGEGGMGVVYKAEDNKLKRTVALKFLPSHLTGKEKDKVRFFHEAQAAAALNHPNVCTIYEIHDEGENPFIVMEYVEGRTLRDIVGARHAVPLPVPDVINYAIQIIEALKAAHAKGIIHRDIKSDNIMITGEGRIKVMDFGLAKLAGKTKLTRTGTTLGTAAYMSPEQARGENVDHRTDIWSFGVVLYEMLTGQLPFKGDYEHAVVFSILNEEPEPVTGLRTGVPVELDHIIKKSMMKDPDERYQTSGDLFVDMRAIMKKTGSGKMESRNSEAKRPVIKYAFVLAAFLLVITMILVIGRPYLFPDDTDKIDSIAVLPLENLSGEPDQEYFVDGMTDALIAELSQISALRVISRTSIMTYKDILKPLSEIADELNVDALIEGTVFRSGDQVRITVRLLQAEPEKNLWTRDYRRNLVDILDLQEEVVRSIANEIKVNLTEEERERLTTAPKVHPESYEAYLRGRYYWNQRTEQGFLSAIEHFEEALDHQPDYALAYAGLADCFIFLGWHDFLPSPDTYPKARAAAEKALEIDETLSEAHTSLAFVKFIYDWKWLDAEKEFKRAIELNPSYALAHQWYAEYLANMARHDESIERAERARMIDPLSFSIMHSYASTLFMARHYDLSIGQFQKILEVDPNYMAAHWFLAYPYVQKAMYNEAIEEVHKAIELSGERYPPLVAWLGIASAYAGQNEEAEKIIEELILLSKQRYVAPCYIVFIYTGLGQIDKAFEWLARAFDVRDDWLPGLKVMPMFDGLRSDSRFNALLKKMDLE
jgi:serine/threonine-protein kinase